MSDETGRQAAGNAADVIRRAHAPGESPQPGDGGSPGGVGSSGDVPIWRPAAPLRQPVLFVNPRSGGGRAVRAGVVGRARELGVAVVVLEPGQGLESLIEEAVGAGADALGVAGGDGSQSVVAAAARAHGLAFVCVPAGTRDHFARDLGLDRRDPVGALDAFADGLEGRIDLGEVNGRIFLNNVSVGIYGDAVQEAAYRDAKTRTLLATARARLAPVAEAHGLRVVDDRGREHVDPAVLLVSNGPYAVERPAAPGARPSLASGRLGIILLDAPGGAARPPGRSWTAAGLGVQAIGPVHAGIDGEAAGLAPPLAFTIRPAALRVRIPARDAAASPPRRPDLTLARHTSAHRRW
jgi:diacylglycerol kinase family enzyme